MFSEIIKICNDYKNLWIVIGVIASKYENRWKWWLFWTINKHEERYWSVDLFVVKEYMYDSKLLKETIMCFDPQENITIEFLHQNMNEIVKYISQRL